MNSDKVKILEASPEALTRWRRDYQSRQAWATRPAKHGTDSPVSSELNISAFSLVEVVLAVGIFAVAVTVILALLPALARQGGSSADSLVALRLPDAVNVELQRVASAGGFDALAAQAKPMSMPLPVTLQLVASHEADRIHSIDYQPPSVTQQIAETEQYFLIEAWQFTQPTLAYDPSGANLALHVRVSWPYRTAGTMTATPLSERDFVTFCVVINR
jgi:hypothetical protein